MKILQKGTLPEKRIWFGYCSNCKSTAEAFEKELIGITHDQREGSFSWEICPVCHCGPYGGMIFHPEKQ